MIIEFTNRIGWPRKKFSTSMASLGMLEKSDRTVDLIIEGGELGEIREIAAQYSYGHPWLGHVVRILSEGEVLSEMSLTDRCLTTNRKNFPGN